MVRIIQPTGFTWAGLVRIGLLEDVEEVILLCSPETMTDEKFDRVKSIAKELGSKAEYTRITFPVIGATIQELLADLSVFKESLNEKETLISTTGSTLLFRGCLLHAFPKCETLTMDWKNSTYFLSRGVTKKLEPLTDGVIWKLFELKHVEKGKTHEIYHGGELVATPSDVELQGEKIHLSWRGSKSSTHQTAKEMGVLCRLNSEDRYVFSVTQDKFVDHDRFPIDTKRNIDPSRGGFFKPVENEFFSNVSLPDFPHGSAKSNISCLHIIVNINDITPTALSIMLHEPSHVVLWVLNPSKNKQRTLEIEGKIAWLIYYLNGDIAGHLDYLKEMNSNFIKSNPLPNMDIEFHLMEIQSLDDTLPILPEMPKVGGTFVELNSGFTGFQDIMMKTLTKANVDYQKWYTDPYKFESYRISEQINIKKKPFPNLSRMLLRKRVPTKGVFLSQDEKFLHQLRIALACILENRHPNNELIGPRPGNFSDDEENNITVVSKGFKPPNGKLKHPSYFEISVNQDRILALGEEGKQIGIWLEDLAAHMIHLYWKSDYSMTGIHSHLLTGDFRLGTEDDIDIYCITDYGVVIGEAKSIINLQEHQLHKYIGQLMGEVAVLGHRHGQIPILVIASDSYKFDDIAYKHKVVICSWWELQYPKRIVHRLKTGKRTEEEITEKKEKKAIEKAKKAAKKAANEEKRRAGVIEKAKKAAENAANSEKSIVEAIQKGREKIFQEKKLKEEEGIAFMERNTVFSDRILLEDVEKIDGTKNSFFLLNVDKLKNKPISIGASKWKIFFDEKKNRGTWTGYNITVVTKSGAEYSNVDIEDDVAAYLLHCEIIKNED
jgi:hypothetical protein